MYGKFAVICALSQKAERESGQFISMFIAMRVMLTYLGKTSPVCQLIASVRVD